MADNRYCVELARSGRSKCKDTQCKGTIDAGELRIGKITKNPFGEGDSDMTSWYHAACIFNALKRARGATKKIESTDDLEGYDDLDKDDQKKARDLIAGKGVAAKGSKKKAPASKKGKKKKDESEDEDEDEEEEEEEEKPKKKAAASKKKASRSRSPSPAAKKKGSKKKDDDDVEKKYYEKDTKFWECWQHGDSFTTRWGKIGTNGATATKSFKSEEEAEKKLAALIRSKEKSGYELAEK